MVLYKRPHRFKPRVGKLGFCTLILPSDIDPTLMNQPAQCYFTGWNGKAGDHLPVGQA